MGVLRIHDVRRAIEPGADRVIYWQGICIGKYVRCASPSALFVIVTGSFVETVKAECPIVGARNMAAAVRVVAAPIVTL